MTSMTTRKVASLLHELTRLFNCRRIFETVPMAQRRSPRSLFCRLQPKGTDLYMQRVSRESAAYHNATAAVLWPNEKLKTSPVLMAISDAALNLACASSPKKK